MPRLSCPDCRLLLDPRWPLIAPDYCPRCLAKYNTAVLLVAADGQRSSDRRGADIKSRNRVAGAPSVLPARGRSPA